MAWPEACYLEAPGSRNESTDTGLFRLVPALDAVKRLRQRSTDGGSAQLSRPSGESMMLMEPWRKLA